MSEHPFKRAVLISLRFLIASAVTLVIAAQFFWVDLCLATPFGQLEFITDQIYSISLFTPPQKGLVCWNQFGSGDYTFGDGGWDYAPNLTGLEARILGHGAFRVLAVAGISCWKYRRSTPTLEHFAFRIHHFFWPAILSLAYSIFAFFPRRRRTDSPPEVSTGFTTT
jgi:hypothetical protein